MGALVYPIPVLPWAVEMNYPGVSPPSYNGTPTKVAPVGDALVPKTKLPAQVLNYLLNANANTVQALQEYVLQVTLSLSASNWAPAFPSTNEAIAGQADFLHSDFGGGACYGPLSQKWALTALVPGTPSGDGMTFTGVAWALFLSSGLDAGGWGGAGFVAGATNWDIVGTEQLLTGSEVVTAMAVCEDPATAGSWWVAVVLNTGGTFVNFWNGSAWSIPLRGFSPGAVSDIQITTLLDYVIVAVTSSVAASGGFVSSNNAFATNTQFNTGLPALPVGSTWSLKSSGAAVLAIPSFATGLGPATQVWKTVDGYTWTVAATLGFLASTDQVVGLAWNSPLGLWTLALQTTAPSVYFYTSPDGITWTLVGPGPSSALTVADMAANVLGALVCTLHESAPNKSAGMIWSADGGATWYPGQAKLFASELPSVYGYSRPRIVSSGQGFLAWTNFSARFSALSGVPASSL